METRFCCVVLGVVRNLFWTVSIIRKLSSGFASLSACTIRLSRHKETGRIELRCLPEHCPASFFIVAYRLNLSVRDGWKPHSVKLLVRRISLDELPTMT